MQNHISIFSLILFLFFSSCENENITPNRPELKVYVEGLISGKTREGVKLTLYPSKNDAEYELNEISYDRSDSKGNSYFYNLNNQVYWIRANTIIGISKTIERIEINQQYNHITLKVL